MARIDRRRGVTIDPIDLTGVLAEAERELRDEGALETDEHVVAGFGPYGLLTGANGSTWLVCNEGVAWEVHEAAPLDLYTEQRDADGTKISFGIAPRWSLRVEADALAAARTGESVDLADFIRVFGDRLDANHFNLYHLATS